METFPADFSKFLDKTNYHLNLQAISSFINLPEQLNEKEKKYIQSHLTQCKLCTDSYELIFDETLELDGKKNIVKLSKQGEGNEEESIIYKNQNNQIEIEISRLSKNDFNLKFKLLPLSLIGEKGALEAGDRYFLRILSMDTETMYIVHSEEDIMEFDSFDLLSVTAPAEIAGNKSVLKQEKNMRKYLYTATAAIVIGIALIIYMTFRSGITDQSNNSKTILSNNKSYSGQNTVGKTLTPAETKGQMEEVQSRNEVTTVADIFGENKDLEKFLERNENINPPVALVSPVIGATVKMPVTFEWMTSQKNITLKFVILNNQNIPVYNNLINGRELTIDTKLDPGLYYWKLESRDSIEALGKFLIRQ
jgi:hypothetical protein